MIAAELAASHRVHGAYPETLDPLPLGFSARPSWGRWAYAEMPAGEYLLYLPYIHWLGGYAALVHRSDGTRYDGTRYDGARDFGDWQVVKGFHNEIGPLSRSYFP